MSQVELDPGVERVDFVAPFIGLLILYLLMLLPVILGHPRLAAIAWAFDLSLMGITLLWLRTEVQSLRAEHDFTMRTHNYQGVARPLRVRLATGFSNFVMGVVVAATLPVYFGLLLIGIVFQSRVRRAASGGMTLFVNGTAVSAVCILIMSVLVYVFRLDTYYWMGPYWMPALLNIAAFFWLLHAVLRPQAVSEAWRISAWPAWLILALIVLASISFGAILNLDLTRRLGLSHGSFSDLVGLLSRFLDLPGFSDVADLVRQAGTGEILHESAGDTLLNLQWTAFGLLLAATSFQLVWKVFSAQRGEHELMTIANLHMSMGDVAAARQVAEAQMTESMIGRHDLLAQVAAVEGDMAAYWAELQAFGERRFYDLYQTHEPYLLHWLSEIHLNTYGKLLDLYLRIRQSRCSFLPDSPVLLYCLMRDAILVPGEPEAPLKPVIADMLALRQNRPDGDDRTVAFLGSIVELPGAEEALQTPAFIPAGADADEARVWEGLHLLFGLMADRLSQRPPEETDELALRTARELVGLYEQVSNPAVKFFYFHILQAATEQPVGPAGAAMPGLFNPALRAGVAGAEKKLARYFK